MNKIKRLQTWLVIPDTHMQAPMKDGKTIHAPMFCHDPQAISLMLQFIQPYKLDGIVHLGDICEMATISAWQAAIGKEGQTQDTEGGWYVTSWAAQRMMAHNFWAYFDKKYPKAEKHQIAGNHDFWSDITFRKPGMQQFKDQAFENWPTWKQFNITYHPYWGGAKDEEPFVYVNAPDCKGTVIMHGYNNASIQKMLKDYDNVVYGHQHKIIRASHDSNLYERRRADCIGCLTKLKAEYNSKGGAQNGWAHGFALIHVLDNGRTQVNVIDIGRDMSLVTESGVVYNPVKLSSLDPLLNVLELE